MTRDLPAANVLLRTCALALAAATPLTFAAPLAAQKGGKNRAPKVIELKRPKAWTSVGSLAFGPKGKFLVGGMGTFTFNGKLTGGDVVLWTTKDGKLKKQMSGHTGPVSAVAMTPDQKKVVSYSGATGEVIVFDARRGKKGNAFKTTPIDSQWVFVKPLLTSDGKSLVYFLQEAIDIAGKEKRITGALQIWDIATGKIRWQRERTFGEVAAVSPDGSLVAYYAQELNWKVVNGEAHYSSPNSVVHVLDMNDGKLVQTLQVGYMPIGGLAFTHDNKQVVAVNEQLHRYSIETGKLVADKVDTGAFGKLNWVQVSADGKRVAWNGEWSNDVILFDLTTTPPTAGKAPVVPDFQPPMHFSPDFTMIACDIKGHPAILDYTRKGKPR